MRITFNDLPEIDAALKNMASAKCRPGLTFVNAMRVVASEHPALFSAIKRIRGRITQSEEVPYRLDVAGLITSETRGAKLTASEKGPPAGPPVISVGDAIYSRQDGHDRQSLIAEAYAPIGREILALREASPKMTLVQIWDRIKCQRPDLIEAYSAACREN